MIRRAIGAAAIILAAAAVVIWWRSSGSEAPAARAQTVAPSIPVTAGTVVAKDVPVFLNGIGTVQAYNMVTVKTRVDGQIVQGRLQGRAGGQGGRSAVPDRSAALSGLARTGAGGQAKGRGAARRRQARPGALFEAARHRLPDPAKLRPADRAGRAAAGRDQGRSGADRQRRTQPRLRRHPLADRRPHSARGSSTKAIWSMPTTTRRWSRLPS